MKQVYLKLKDSDNNIHTQVSRRIIKGYKNQKACCLSYDI